MPLRNRVIAHRWPILAGVLSVAFIVAGLTVLQRARQVHQRIGHELRLAKELDRLGSAIHTLGLVHRVETSSEVLQWHEERKRLDAQVRDMQTRYEDAPGMQGLPNALDIALARTDSLHQQAMERRHDLQQRSVSDAVMQIMLRRAQQEVEQASRTLHEEGLAVHAAALSTHWQHARVLLLAACLLAVAVAWLSSVSNRLLRESQLHGRQLERTHAELERTHKELRETMLSKEEKEVMIKEIHHRVKNNLQIVKSLIRFQMEQVKDEQTMELFNECVNRVSAMALVHEQTYLSKDLANIDVSSYLQALIRDLVHAYAVGIRLHLDVDIRVRTLGVDTLVPLGLLINEVISNSFKHAFKGRTHGTITVHLSGSETEGLELRIGDDGIGLPERDSWREPKSLGMELIHTLAGQLDLALDRADAPGTLYDLKPEGQGLQRRA